MMQKKEHRPLTFRIGVWYGFAFAAVFIIYGGVRIVLDILDRNYDDLAQPILFGIVGLILISVAIAYRELRTWGWYGLIAINGLVIVGALLNYTYLENLVLLGLSAIALYALLATSTKEYLFRQQ